MFHELEWTKTTSWIFLPAAVRLLVVLLWRWWGAVGLLLGALLTNVSVFGWLTPQSLVVATLSAAAPCVAVELGRRWLDIAVTLQGITAVSLLKLLGISAAISVILHGSYFWLSGTAGAIGDVVPMFVGDVIGTLIVLYVTRALLGLADRSKRERQ